MSEAADPIRIREKVLRLGFVTREMILDHIVPLSEMTASPLWEEDPVTMNWYLRTPEFLAERAAAQDELPALQAAAEIALNAVVIKLADETLPQADGPPCDGIAGVGRYVTLTSYNLGEVPYTYHLTSAEAIAEWKRRFLAYLADHPSAERMWWRIRPTIQSRISFGETRGDWMVYSRVLAGPAELPPQQEPWE